jgi:hypothetical protein
MRARVGGATASCHEAFAPSSGAVRAHAQTGRMIVEELGRLANWGERHRRLIARILLALGLTAVVDVAGAILIWALERHAKGSEIHGIGDAFFFATVQLLTVSSQIKNPVTAVGKVVDVGLEIWALFVVTAVAGSFAAFFGSAD